MNTRNNVRANLQTQVIISGIGREGMPFEITGRSIDISRAGYGILLDPAIISFDCPVGSEVTLSSAHKFHSRATIQWIRKDPISGRYRIGLRLIEQTMSPWFKIAASLLLCWAFCSQVSYARSGVQSGRDQAPTGGGQTQSEPYHPTPPDLIASYTAAGAGGDVSSEPPGVAKAPQMDDSRSWVEQAITDQVGLVGDVVPTQIQIDLTKNQYAPGETITAGVARIFNPSDVDRPVELKTWLASTSEEPLSIGNVGSDGQYILAAGSEQDFGPLQVLPEDRDLPAGQYEFNARMLNPVTGDLLSQESSPFSFAADPDPAAVMYDAAPPALSISAQTTKSDYRLGDTVSLSDGCTIANAGASEAPVELKMWLEGPTQKASPIAVFAMGGDGSFILTPGSSMRLEPMEPFKVTGDFPAGTYQLKSRAMNPVTGQIFQESVHYFTIR